MAETKKSDKSGNNSGGKSGNGSGGGKEDPGPSTNCANAPVNWTSTAVRR